MKKAAITILIFVSIITTGCITIGTLSQVSGLSKDYLNEVPPYSKMIYIEKENVPIDKLYDELLGIIIDRNHRIVKDDRQMHYIVTEGRDVGQSTLQRMTISIKQTNNLCIAKIATEWKAGTEAMMMANAMSGIVANSDWATAYMAPSRPGIAFTESLRIAKETGGEIRFEK
ncbi:MAG: hypothetical protein GX459_12800 [Bacteroidales bacterium]|nr:hypothetical protein [Bacteroidales bacterium]